MTRRTFLAASSFFAAPPALAAAKPDRTWPSSQVLQWRAVTTGSIPSSPTKTITTAVPAPPCAWSQTKSIRSLRAGLPSRTRRHGPRLFNEGHLAVVQGVGYPNMHRDHTIGMQSWQTASPSPQEHTGWLGRVADRCADPDRGNVPVAFVGQIPAPLAMHSREGRSSPPFATPGSGRSAHLAAVICHHREADPLPISPAAQPSHRLRLRPACRRDLENLTPIRLSRSSCSPNPSTPSRNSSAPIWASASTWWSRAGPRPGSSTTMPTRPVNHAVSLRELSQSVTAFCDDLAHDHLLDRVLLMTFSEFGRTLTENGRHGTGTVPPLPSSWPADG